MTGCSAPPLCWKRGKNQDAAEDSLLQEFCMAAGGEMLFCGVRSRDPASILKAGRILPPLPTRGLSSICTPGLGEDDAGNASAMG